MEQTPISTTRAPAAIGPYTQAIRFGQFIYTSGQIALDPTSGQIAGSDIETQTHRVLQNLQAVLEAAQSDLAHVVKTTVFLTTMDNFAAMNAVYASYFEATGRPAPARSTIAVAALPRNALVEIECVAFVEA
jgi:2-iminobutanoate/2-iminopropanoate deaminase